MRSGDTDMCAMWKDRFSTGLSAYLIMMAVIAPGTTANAQSPPERQVTFTKDVAPILQRSCQICHRPGSIAPMSLLKYEEGRPWVKAIKENTRPFSIKTALTLLHDNDLFEYVCVENEKDRVHLGK